MFVGDLFEDTGKNITVVYPGRFMPPHKGHKAVYDHLCQKYGGNNVYVVTSDKTDNLKSPFNFAEKRKMWTLMGVSSEKVIMSTQPYRAMEIVSKLDPSSVLMFAISEKDMAEDPRFQFAPKKDGSPSYFQPFKDAKQCKPLNEHAYMITVPTFDFTVLGKPANSASQIRAQFGNADEETKKKIVADLFGKFDPVVYNIMNNKLLPVPAAVGESTVTEASKHKKEVEAKRKKYEQEQAAKREKEGETYNYGNAKVTKPPVNEISNDLSKNYMRGAMHDTITGKKDRNPGISQAMNRISGTQYPLIPDTENPDPKIRSLAIAVEKMKDQLASLTGQPTTESTMKNTNEGSVPKDKQKTPYKTMDQHVAAGNAAKAKLDAEKKAKDAATIGKKKVNELSSNTLGKYKKAASETLPKNMHQAGNRAQGVAKAKDKIQDKEITAKAKAVGHPMVQEDQINEESPLSAAGFSKEFINQVYRLFNIEHTEIPEPMTAKPKAGDLKKYVFLSKTNSGKAFAVGMQDRNWSAPNASIVIDNEGTTERKSMPATKALAQVAKGQYFAIPFAHQWGDRIRGQGGTEYKRANPRDGRREDPQSKTYEYMTHVEKLYGPKIRAEMNKVADFVYANLRRFDKKTNSNLRGTSHQEQVLDIANKLEAAAKEPFSTRITGSWDRPSYMEQYLQSLSTLSHGFGSIPANYGQFVKAMDTTPAGLAKFAKFILGTVRVYEERVKNMLASEVMEPLKAESIGESDHGGVPWGPVAQKEYFENWHKWDQAVRYNGGTTEHAGDGTYRAAGIDDGGIGQWNEHTGEGWIDLTGESDLEEGRFVKGTGGVPLDRQGNPRAVSFPAKQSSSNSSATRTTTDDSGVKVTYGKYHEPRKSEAPGYGSKHIGSGSGKGTTKGQVSGLGANTGKNVKPVVTADVNGDEASKVAEAGPTFNLNKFPDSKEGIIAFLNDKKEISQSYAKQYKQPGCKIYPDNHVEGVWAVDNYKTEGRLIIYLGGYKDPMGKIRPYNDFEGGEIPEKEMKRHRRNDQAQDDTDDYMNEAGRFVKGPGGVPLDRYGDPIPPKPPKAPARKKLTLDDVWRKVEDVVGQIYPDGDPIDWMAPWLERHGIEEFKIGEIIDRAARKNGYKDMYDYWKQLDDQMKSDAAYDSGQMNEGGEDPRWELYAKDDEKGYTLHHIPHSQSKPGEQRFKHSLKGKTVMSHSKQYPDEMAKHMNEQQVDELSTDTMKRYMGAANKSRTDATTKFNQTGNIDSKTMDKMGNRAERTMKTANKVKATEPVNELSKNTLGSYSKKAADDAIAQGGRRAPPHHVMSQMSPRDQDVYRNAAKKASLAKKNRETGLGRSGARLDAMESKSSLKAIVKEMHEQAAQGNLRAVAECVRALVPFKQKESLKEGIMTNVEKALKVAKRNAG